MADRERSFEEECQRIHEIILVQADRDPERALQLAVAIIAKLQGSASSGFDRSRAAS